MHQGALTWPCDAVRPSRPVRWPCPDFRSTQSDPADARELDSRSGRADAEYEAKQIDLDALLYAYDDSGKTKQGDLDSTSARCRGEDPQ